MRKSFFERERFRGKPTQIKYVFFLFSFIHLPELCVEPPHRVQRELREEVLRGHVPPLLPGPGVDGGVQRKRVLRIRDTI